MQERLAVPIFNKIYRIASGRIYRIYVAHDCMRAQKSLAKFLKCEYNVV
jgi:hypothetical protein